MSFNRIFLVGHVGNEPTIREVGKNRVISLRVATNEQRRVGLQYVQDTQWHTVTAWNKEADKIAALACAGKMVVVEGRLSHKKYFDVKTKKPQFTSEIIVYSLSLLEAAAQPEPGLKIPKQREDEPEGEGFDPLANTPIGEDDLPF